MNSAFPDSTNRAFRRAAASINFGDRFTAVSRPSSSRSHTNVAATPVAAADLEDPVVGTQRELIDDQRKPLAHSSFVVDAESRIVFPSGSSTIAKRSSGVTSYGAQCDS